MNDIKSKCGRLNVHVISWVEKDAEISGISIVDCAWWENSLGKERTHQVKGMDLERAMELWVDSYRCAINLCSTIWWMCTVEQYVFSERCQAKCQDFSGVYVWITVQWISQVKMRCPITWHSLYYKYTSLKWAKCQCSSMSRWSVIYYGVHHFTCSIMIAN